MYEIVYKHKNNNNSYLKIIIKNINNNDKVEIYNIIYPKYGYYHDLLVNNKVYNIIDKIKNENDLVNNIHLLINSLHQTENKFEFDKKMLLENISNWKY